MLQTISQGRHYCERPASLGFRDRKEFIKLANKAFSKNPPGAVAKSVGQIARADRDGAATRFLLEFYANTENSTGFITNLQTQNALQISNLKSLRNAFRMIQLRKLLGQENSLWKPIEVNERLYGSLVNALTPVFQLPNKDKGLAATWALSNLNEIRQGLRSSNLGAHDFLFAVHKFLLKQGIFFNAPLEVGTRKIVLFKVESVCAAPNSIYLENGSDRIFDNSEDLRSRGGYFLNNYGSIIVLNNHKNKEQSSMKVPHEIEHSVQNFFGLIGKLDDKLIEYGAYLAQLLSLKEHGAYSLLASWGQDPFLKYIFGNPSSPHELAKDMAVENAGNKASWGRGRRKDTLTIVRELLDEFYAEHLGIAYTALEKTAEKMLGKGGAS